MQILIFCQKYWLPTFTIKETLSPYYSDLQAKFLVGHKTYSFTHTVYQQHFPLKKPLTTVVCTREKGSPRINN